MITPQQRRIQVVVSRTDVHNRDGTMPSVYLSLRGRKTHPPRGEVKRRVRASVAQRAGAGVLYYLAHYPAPLYSRVCAYSGGEPLPEIRRCRHRKKKNCAPVHRLCLRSVAFDAQNVSNENFVYNDGKSERTQSESRRC